ncbi:unnamed protein product [Owenia fusiformis]|uniref:Uncharacterized protein n=1 Tax=Owenia fusiformis TaxID=6347 RepID=A0A8J1U9V4_OWEFU|nr:unnamed protein product [Owenia fusiformis]
MTCHRHHLYNLCLLYASVILFVIAARQHINFLYSTYDKMTSPKRNNTNMENKEINSERTNEADINVEYNDPTRIHIERNKSLDDLKLEKLKQIEKEIKNKYGFVIKASDFEKYGKARKEDCLPGTMKRPPDIIIIGVQKCGTAVLRSMLAMHPTIAAQRKEAHFFNRSYREGVPYYLEQLPCSKPNQLTLEKTPAYFDLTDPALLYAFNPNMKLILSVCDPVNRTISAFVHEKRMGHIPLERSFTEEILTKDGAINASVNITKRSNYLAPITKYHRYFPPSQLYIHDYDLTKQKPWEGLNKIENYLGIDNIFTQSSFWFNNNAQVFCLDPPALNLTKEKLKTQNMFEDGCMNYFYKEHMPKPKVSEKILKMLRRHYGIYSTAFSMIVRKSFNWSPTVTDWLHPDHHPERW